VRESALEEIVEKKAQLSKGCATKKNIYVE
jgi:hypothetical protein